LGITGGESKMAGESEAQVEKLVRRLRHTDLPVRTQAAAQLADLGPAAREAVPMLVEMLRGDSVEDRKLAARTLGSIGRGALPAVPVLVNAVHDADEIVRGVAAVALEKIEAATGRAGVV
jgi:HEAT repeat protein